MELKTSKKVLGGMETLINWVKEKIYNFLNCYRLKFSDIYISYK